MFSRKRLSEDLVGPFAVFCEQAERVENARQALLSCLPVGRVDPVPIPVGLDLVADEVAAVREDMDAWRVPPVEDHWEHCRRAMDEAEKAIPAARDVAASTGELEELLDAVGEVVEPLDAWHDAERHWRSLRRRG